MCVLTKTPRELATCASISLIPYFGKCFFPRHYNTNLVCDEVASRHLMRLRACDLLLHVMKRSLGLTVTGGGGLGNHIM